MEIFLPHGEFAMKVQKKHHDYHLFLIFLCCWFGARVLRVVNVVFFLVAQVVSVASQALVFFPFILFTTEAHCCFFRLLPLPTPFVITLPIVFSFAILLSIVTSSHFFLATYDNISSICLTDKNNIVGVVTIGLNLELAIATFETWTSNGAHLDVEVRMACALGLPLTRSTSYNYF